MKKNFHGVFLGMLASVMFLTAAYAAEGTNPFPTRLYKALSTAEAGRNFVYSPYSVSQAFGLAGLGARGATRQEIEKVIGTGDLAPFPSPSPSTEPELFVANRIWLQKGFTVEKTYLNECKTSFGAEPGTVDFTGHSKEAARTINQWVEDRTHGKIKNLIPTKALDARSRMILTNAVYFKSAWRFPFEPARTYDEDFALSSGAKVHVPLMHQRKHFNYAEDGQVQVLQMLYQGERYAMVVVLPKKGVSLAEVEKRFSVSKIIAWESALKSNNVELSLPRFRFDSSFLLNDSLRKIGLKRAFDATEADFSGIDGRKDLYVAQVFHKAFLKVDEAGTEAAAATAIHMAMAAAFDGQKPIEFSVKKPFIFYIEELKSKTVLFLGRLTDPEK